MHDKKPNITCAHGYFAEYGRCPICAPAVEPEQPACSCGKPERGRGPWHSPGRCAMYVGALDLPVVEPQPSTCTACRIGDERRALHTCDKVEQPTCLACGIEAQPLNHVCGKTQKPCPDCPGDGTGMCCKTTNKAGDNYATQSIQEDAFNAGVEAEWARLEGMAMVADILIGKDGVMSAQVAKVKEMSA